MDTSSLSSPSAAQDLAHHVFDVLRDKKAGDSMWRKGATREELDQVYAQIESRLDFIARRFKRGAAPDQPPGFVSEFAHTLKTEFAKDPQLKATWDDPRLQRLVGVTLGKDLQVLVQDTAHPVSKVAFKQPVEPSTKIQLPEAAHEQEFVKNMGAAITEHETQIRLTQSSALGAIPIRSVAQSAVDAQYKEALKNYKAGLEASLDKKLFHDSAMLELEKALKANPAHIAALQHPEIHEAVKQHLGEEIAAKLHSIAPARAFDAQHIQDFAARLKTGLETHEQQLKLAGASAEVQHGTEALVAGHYKAAVESFSKGLKGATDVKAFHEEARAVIAQIVQDHPHTKATLLNPVVKESLEKHAGYGIADFVQNAAHPEIAAKKAADAAVAAAAKAAATAAEESAAVKAAAAIEKAATKVGGKAKWLVAGAGTAVALGAFMHLDGKSHARNVQNRANNPLNDAALAR